MRFFTSDTHFFHKNIIKHCNRPYGSVDEMHSGLIDIWNSQVTVHDEVYVMGDFMFRCNQEQGLGLINRLNGKIFLIPGDHDVIHPNIKIHQRFHVMPDVYEINPTRGRVESIVLCHWPFRMWRKSHYGAWHLFGHLHFGLHDYGKSFNVGIDHWGKLLSEDDIVNIMEKLQQNINFIPPEKRRRG